MKSIEEVRSTFRSKGSERNLLQFHQIDANSEQSSASGKLQAYTTLPQNKQLLDDSMDDEASEM